ncbi:MAG TPA: DUF4968 domain-containing protein, partial [Polyangia bacterium]|nr:DUF4968 domain-containing protein [Polyangia bacterium]
MVRAKRLINVVVAVAAAVGCASPQGPVPAPAGPSAPVSVQRLPDGVLVRLGDGLLKLEVCAADVVRVAYARNEAFFVRPSLMAQPKRCEGAPFDLQQAAGALTLSTAKVHARVDLASGRVAFLDAAGA